MDVLIGDFPIVDWGCLGGGARGGRGHGTWRGSWMGGGNMAIQLIPGAHDIIMTSL